jgi:DNA-binding beta-propeller fold protein YncE
VPLDAVSIVPNPAQTALYVLQANGLVDVISLAGGKISSSFQVGDPGISLALSPDGSTLYVLKGSPAVSNIAVVGVATQSIRRVLPAPGDCHQVLVSASGKQLLEVVGTVSYGNIQIFAS